MHEQLNSSLPDLQSRHVGQKIIAHKEAHEHCKNQIQSGIKSSGHLARAGMQ